MSNLQTATQQDFKVGNTLICSQSNMEHVITSKYDDGIYEAKVEGGLICIFTSEARFYKINK